MWLPFAPTYGFDPGPLSKRSVCPSLHHSRIARSRRIGVGTPYMGTNVHLVRSFPPSGHFGTQCSSRARYSSGLSIVRLWRTTCSTTSFSRVPITEHVSTGDGLYRTKAQGAVNLYSPRQVDPAKNSWSEPCREPAVCNNHKPALFFCGKLPRFRVVRLVFYVARLRFRVSPSPRSLQLAMPRIVQRRKAAVDVFFNPAMLTPPKLVVARVVWTTTNPLYLSWKVIG